MGITDDVVWVGGVPLDETVRFYQAADVNVYPSHGETFGLPILEAMACACPVVTSNVTAMPEIAGGAAVLCDPGRPAVDRARRSSTRSEATGCAQPGLRRASEFTWAATGAATLDVYRDVAEQRRRRRAR